jgi:nitroreductase
MKKSMAVVCFLIIACLTPGALRLDAQESGAQKTGVIAGHYAARDFTAGEISREDLNLILNAGVRAPSANNQQPWHFTVVRNQALGRQIVSNLTDGNVLIVISGPGDGKTNNRVILDCALATQSVYLAAQALGLGSRIYTGPMDTINSRFKSELGLPDGYSAVALVRVGRVRQPVDAVSAASARNPPDSTVTYK